MKRLDIVCAILMFLLMISAVYHIKSCSSEPKKIEKVSYKTIKKAVHDTVYIANPVPAETVFVPVPADVDTAAIISDYFTQYIYVDTLHPNQYVDIKITDSVSCNKLMSHKVELLSVPDVYVPPNAGSARCLALGAIAGFEFAILKLDYSTDRHVMSIGYDIKSKNPVVGYSFRLFSW